MSKYGVSLFDGEYEGCFLCKARNCDLQHHEIFFGSDREASIQYGIWVYLCPKCHHNVHFGKDPTDKIKLWRAGQDKFDSVYGKEKFGKVFSKRRFV